MISPKWYTLWNFLNMVSCFKKNCSYSWWYRPLKGIRKTITSTHIYQRAHIHAFTSTHTCAQFHGQSSTCTCLKQRRSHIAVSYTDYHVRMGGWVGGSYRAKFEYICTKKHGLTTGDVYEPPFAWIPGSSAIASQLYTSCVWTANRISTGWARWVHEHIDSNLLTYIGIQSSIRDSLPACSSDPYVNHSEFWQNSI